MEVFLASIVFAVIWFAVSVIWNLVKGIHPTTPSAMSLINNKIYGWFFGLLFLNLTITGFILGYYYYRTKIAVGPPGPRGYPGLEGGRVIIEK